MARIRSLKIGFFHNEELCDLSPWHRLLFEGLWILADREGRLEDRPRRIKAELFPYDEIDVEILLTDLARRGFLLRYDADGVPAIAIVNFLKHQRPNSKEAASDIPAPTCEQHEKDRARHEKGEGEWSTGNGVLGMESGNGAEAAEAAPFALTRAEDLMQAWNDTTHPPIPRCRELTTKRKKHCHVRLKEAQLSEWVEIFRRIQASAFCRGEKGNWVASFDWAIGSADVRVKVLEGKYDDRDVTPPRPLTPIGGKVKASQVGRRELVPPNEPL